MFSDKKNIRSDSFQKQQPGKREAVASVVAASAQDKDTAAVRISAADNVRNSECGPLHENQGRNPHAHGCQAVTCLHLFTVQYIIHSLPPPVSGNADSSGFSVIRAFSPAFPEKRPVLMNFPGLVFTEILTQKQKECL
jgi:hypothetical protein